MAKNYVLYKQRAYSKKQCAEAMLSQLNEQGITRTPDGAPYSVSSIRAAMIGM